MKKVFLIGIGLLLLFLLAACGSSDGGRELERALSFSSYEEIYAALSEANAAAPEGGAGMAVDEAAAESEVAVWNGPAEGGAGEMDGAGGMGGKGDDGVDVSGTNVQVEGIDEGDIIKTDGKYLYILRDRDFSVLKMAGAESEELCNVQLLEEEKDIYEEKEDGSWRSEYAGGYARDMYLWEDKLAILVSNNAYLETYDATTEKWDWDETQRTALYLYDVQDPASPQLLKQFEQDGNYQNSRLADGVLYLLSNYNIWNYTEGDKPSYIPCVYVNGEASLLAASDICRMPGAEDLENYLQLSALDLADGELMAQEAILGGGWADMYMNAENLYLAVSRWESEELDSRKESVYTVTDWEDRYSTCLMRISLAGASLKPAATGTVPGSILNQFAMDEYDGNLRIVTTDDRYRYTSYEDEKYGFTNYRWPDEDTPASNGLYVLDEDLSLLGKLDGLAEDERVYAVRFFGDTGYFVTYRQIDPLFAVDLSDPAAPKILAELKLPGFSEYLHPYGEGLLFGLGYSVNESRGWTENLKLSMFAISDPAAVSELATLELEEGYSPATGNHHAILADAEKNIIAFPTEEEYVIYSWDVAENRFLRQAAFGLDDWGGSARGCYADGIFYLSCMRSVTVIDMQSWAELAHVMLSEPPAVG